MILFRLALLRYDFPISNGLSGKQVPQARQKVRRFVARPLPGTMLPFAAHAAYTTLTARACPRAPGALLPACELPKPLQRSPHPTEARARPAPRRTRHVWFDRARPRPHPVWLHHFLPHRLSRDHHWPGRLPGGAGRLLAAHATPAVP
ncbi:hypothetical protein CT19431_MP130117 [Cupriavidus taiwanensis]|nr:hypothetical protein CT19431_MP130117 [Cupriavidus taiwanensis]